MPATESITGLLESLESEGVGVVVALLPAGQESSGIVSRLADEAESRIMADLERAVRMTAALVALADARAERAVRARTRRVHGQALTYSNRFEDALASLRDALEFTEDANDPVEIGRIRLTMLHVFARQARFDEAVSCGTLARDAFRAAGEREHVGRAENNLGIIERMRDRPGEAIVHFACAAEALAGQPPLLAHVENNRAEALLDLDRFGEAESAFGSALQAFREAKAHRHAGIVLGNLADLASRQGRMHEALTMFEEARRSMGEAAAPGDAARLAVEQADVLQNVGLLAGARSGYEEAIPLLESLGMTAESARAHLGLGRVQLRLGEGTAAATIGTSLELFRRLGNHSATARALALGAELSARSGDHATAVRLLAEAREGVLDRPAAAAALDLLYADILRRTGALDGAVEAADGAARTAESLGIAPLAADLLHVSGRAKLGLGAPAAARDRLQRAVHLAERARGTLQSDRFRSAFIGDRAGIWEDCTTAVLDAGGPGGAEEAFRCVELAKSRSLLELLTGGVPVGGDRDGDGTLLTDLARITGELNAMYGRAEDALGERTRAQIREHEAAAERIVLRLAATSRFAGAFAGPAALGSLAGSLPDDGAILEYFAEQGWLSAFVITRAGVVIRRRIADLATVQSGCDALGFQMSRAIVRGLPGGARGERLTRDVNEELAAISRLVLGSIADALPASGRLAIVPTSPLHAVPFAALPFQGEPLIRRFAIAMSPSASLLNHLPTRADGAALVIGVADELAPRAEAEAHDIAATLPGATVLTGPGATRGGFARLSAGRSHIHFAGHARFIPSNPLASGLRFADGWLTATEIARLDLGGASVMLSGCDTGRAIVSGADEQLGLARAILAARASSLTMSLWPVHDEITSLLMRTAYRSRGGTDPGVSVAAAVRTAQLELLASHPHPAAWAPFVTVHSPWSN
jgi:tetratricopeptide (TPR) repeat protein